MNARHNRTVVAKYAKNIEEENILFYKQNTYKIV
jgi:hypothetical protein